MKISEEQFEELKAEYARAVRRDLTTPEICWDLSCNVPPWQREILQAERERRQKSRDRVTATEGEG